MLERHGMARDADSNYWLGWSCVLSPSSGADPAQLVSLAEKGLATRIEWWRGRNVILLGAALYRAGRFEDALKPLTESTTFNWVRHRRDIIYIWFFLAMAHQRLGHAEEARRWLDKGIQATEEALKPPPEPAEKSIDPNGAIAPDWHRKLTFQLLRQEALELIRGPGVKSGK
jgi:hypothetical protein